MKNNATTHGGNESSTGSSTEHRSDTPNLTDLVAAMGELYELSDGGKAEWWPWRIKRIRGGWVYSTGYDSEYHIAPPDAHDILTAHAERWLRARGWDIYRFSDEPFSRYRMSPLHTQREHYHSLAPAIRAEMGREQQCH